MISDVAALLLIYDENSGNGTNYATDIYDKLAMRQIAKRFGH